VPTSSKWIERRPNLNGNRLRASHAASQLHVRGMVFVSLFPTVHGRVHRPSARHSFGEQRNAEVAPHTSHVARCLPPFEERHSALLHASPLRSSPPRSHHRSLKTQGPDECRQAVPPPPFPHPARRPGDADHLSDELQHEVLVFLHLLVLVEFMQQDEGLVRRAEGGRSHDAVGWGCAARRPLLRPSFRGHRNTVYTGHCRLIQANRVDQSRI